MFKSKRTSMIVALLMAAGSAQTAYAQTTDEAAQIANEQSNYNKRIKRDVQPVTYWVDSTTLRLRDNPVAGKIIGKLEYGQKILAYSQYENWVRVSKSGTKAKWVNSDFLSNSRLSWANYNRNTSTRSSDVIAVRIKDPKDRKNKIYGVRLKTAETGNALITTRHNTAEGIYYQNRFVSCNNQQAIGVRLVGEGNNFLGAQNDERNFSLDIYEPDQINDKINGSADSAISSFACKAQSF